MYAWIIYILYNLYIYTDKIGLWGIQIQKEVKSNPKQPSCKKESAALRKAMVKKDMKSKVAAVMVG